MNWTTTPSAAAPGLGGQWVTNKSPCARVSAAATSPTQVALVWENMALTPDVAITVTVTVDNATAGVLEWRAHVQVVRGNAASVVLLALSLPVVPGLVFRDGLDSVLHGQDFGYVATPADPAGLLGSLEPLRGGFMNFGAPVTIWGPDGGSNTLPLVAHLLNASATGLYMAVHDPAGNLKTVLAARTSATTWGLRAMHMLAPGAAPGLYVLPSVFHMQAFNGSAWHAAQIYRSWALPNARSQK